MRRTTISRPSIRRSLLPARWPGKRALRGPGGVQQDRVIGFPVFTSVLLVTSLLILPMSSPVLRPASWVRYTTALHLHGDTTERFSTGPLPQFFADRFGWREEVDIVQKTFQSLSPADQRRICIFGGNYGEAGAIDFLGHLGGYRERAQMPPALSGQNSYWMWGTHGCDPDLSIAVIPDTPQEIGQKYRSAQVVGVLDNPWSMPFEHRRVYLLRGRRPTAPFHWEDERFYF